MGQGGMHERHLMRMEMYADKIEKPVHDRQLGLRWNPLWFQINWNTYTTWIQPILNLVSKNHGSVVSMGWTVFGCSLSYWYSILGWVNHGNHWTSVSCCLLKRSTLQSMLHGITRFFLVKSKILFLISPEWDLCNPLWHFFGPHIIIQLGVWLGRLDRVCPATPVAHSRPTMDLQRSTHVF